MELEVGIKGRLRKEANSKVITETSAHVSNKVKIEWLLILRIAFNLLDLDLKNEKEGK
jgi:hypothetical protein